jgi:hypothetical protein
VGEETAKRHNGYDDHFPALGEFVIDNVVVTGCDVLHVGHIMVADGGYRALELETVLFISMVP